MILADEAEFARSVTAFCDEWREECRWWDRQVMPVLSSLKTIISEIGLGKPKDSSGQLGWLWRDGQAYLFLLLLVFCGQSVCALSVLCLMCRGEWVTICSGVESENNPCWNDGQPIEDLDSSEQACPFSFLRRRLHLYWCSLCGYCSGFGNFLNQLFWLMMFVFMIFIFAEDFIQR